MGDASGNKIKAPGGKFKFKFPAGFKFGDLSSDDYEFSIGADGKKKYKLDASGNKIKAKGGKFRFKLPSIHFKKREKKVKTPKVKADIDVDKPKGGLKFGFGGKGKVDTPDVDLD